MIRPRKTSWHVQMGTESPRDHHPVSKPCHPVVLGIWGKDGSQSDPGNRYGTDQNGPGPALIELAGPGCLREPVGEILTDCDIGDRATSQSTIIFSF